MLYVRNEEKGICYRLDPPVFVRRQSNDVVVRVGSLTLAQGVLSPDHREIWQLSGRPSLGDGFEEVSVITAAEYDAWVAEKEEPEIEEPEIETPEIEEPEIETPEIEDPEDTNPTVPEGTDPATILTRAELTEKVMELDEALQMILSEEVEE